MPAQTYRCLQVAAVVAAALYSPAQLLAQTVISARAGLLNFTQGCVLLDGKHIEFSRSRVVHLVPGQRLRTEDGHAEIMLGPQVFLRLGFESEAEMVSTDLAEPQVRLWGGSAMIDADGLTNDGPVTVLAGKAEVRLVKKGLYRVDLPAEGPHGVTVRNGRAVVVIENHKRTIPERHELEIGEEAGQLETRRIGARKEDALDGWNHERASAIAELNGELLRKQLEEDRQEKDMRLWDKLGIWGR
jgi:hypothetical protein